MYPGYASEKNCGAAGAHAGETCCNTDGKVAPQLPQSKLSTKKLCQMQETPPHKQRPADFWLCGYTKDFSKWPRISTPPLSTPL